jgi:hypothetical protein
MTTITDLVQTLISDDPEIYGSDKGTGRLFNKVLEVLEKDSRDATKLLTTVERIRRKFLADNPRFDFRVADKKK